MVEQDYILRMIKDMVRVLFAVTGLKGQKSDLYDSDEAERVYLSDKLPLKEYLSLMVQRGEINQAENLLFEEMNLQNPSDFQTAVHFYASLNELDDQYLANCSYSREEIFDGLHECARLYGIDENILERFKL